MAIFCTNCGKQIEEGGAFCYACGKAVSQTQPAVTPAAPVATKKKSKAPLIIACVAVLVLAFALVGVFTQGFGLLGDVEETSGSIANSSETPTQENTHPATTPSPEVMPASTTTPEVTPSETPTPGVTPSESPTPEATPTETPDLPPNHISAEFLDLVANGVDFYFEYVAEEEYLEKDYADGFDPDDLWYYVNHPHRWFFEDARQGSVGAHTWLASGATIHYIIKDSKEYKIHLYYGMQGLADWMEVRDADPITKGTISPNFGIHSMGSTLEYVGSGVGAINGVTMPYDIYNETIFGMEIGVVYRVYLDGDTVSYMTVYTDKGLGNLYSFSEISLSVPPDKLWLFDVPEDIPIK